MSPFLVFGGVDDDPVNEELGSFNELPLPWLIEGSIVLPLEVQTTRGGDVE